MLMETVAFSEKTPEQLLDIRFVGAINGCYSLSARKQASGTPAVYACRVQSITPRSAVLSAAVPGDVGEAVRLKLDDLGLLRATIAKVVEGGFVIDIVGTPEQQMRLAARIDWLKKRKFRAFKDRREHKRIQTRDPHSVLVFPDSRMTACFVIDVSRSGVAVSARICPPVGTPLAVGRLAGRVVRHIEAGFAVHFASLQEEETLEPQLATFKGLTDEKAVYVAHEIAQRVTQMVKAEEAQA